MRRTQVVYEGETIGQRLGRFVALLGIVFVIALAVIVSQRFSAETLALIVGLLLAGVPLLAVVGLLFFVLIRQGRRPRNEPQQMMMPPIIMQMPQAPQNALPGDGGIWDFGQRQPATAGRSWDVLGED
jgi:hypothetical protein